MCWLYSCLQTYSGVDPADDLNYATFLSFIHEDDLPIMKQMMTKAINQQTDGFHVEYRIKNTGNDTYWIRADGIVIFEEQKAIRIAGTMQDITERKLNEMYREEMLSIVRHEINTPLTSLHGYLQLLERLIPRRQQIEQVLDRTARSAERLENIIKDYLSNSILQNENRVSRIQNFRFDELVREIADNVQTIFSTHRLHLPTDMPDVWIYGDRQDLGQVVSNLLTNAIKYSPAGNRIDISMETANATVTLSIRDYGIGIAQDNLSKLFKKSYRVNTQSAIKGSGMGLYICHQIINRHKGLIGVTSTEGRGSTFYFTLPMVI